MPTFQGSDFAIELANEYSDESTYAFAFPASGNFRPSVVVKTERLTAPVELPVYAAEQREKIKGMLPGVEVIHVGTVRHGEFAAQVSVYDWGDAARRVRQVQRCILLENPARVVTLTGTALRETYAETEALFEAIFESYRALPGNGA
ncbi:MAG: DcrB-related protein [Bryobacteraceae bacterium]